MKHREREREREREEDLSEITEQQMQFRDTREKGGESVSARIAPVASSSKKPLQEIVVRKAARSSRDK